MTPEGTQELHQAVRTIIVRRFKLADSVLTQDLRMGGVGGWDSLAHMELVVELEDALGVRFSTPEIAELTSAEAIVQRTQGKRSTTP